MFCVVFKVPLNVIGSQREKLIIQKLNMAFEDKFGVTIADEDLGTLKTVGDIFNYLAARAA